MRKVSAVLMGAAISLLVAGCEKEPVGLEANPLFIHAGGACGFPHGNMFPPTVISPDPLLLLSPPVNVTATWTFNRPIADALKAHGVTVPSELRLVGPGGLNTPATSLGAVSNGDRTIDINFSGAVVGAALNTHLVNLGQQQATVSLTVHAHWDAQPHLLDVQEGVCPQTAHGTDQILAIRTIPVDIDVKPGSDPNSINRGSMGKVPVAILGSSIDVTTIDQETVRLGDAAPAKTKKSFDDVDGDGEPDLVLQFVQKEIGLGPNDTEVTLTGLTNDGIPIEGSDAVRITPSKN